MFGVYAPGQPVAHLTYLGLYALQHRGQESAGMAVSDGETVTVVKDMGLVSNAFDDRTLAALTGHLAIGHNRYSTTGSSNWRNAQPVYRDVGAHTFALGHNGNLVNTEALAAEAGMLPGAITSDSDLVAELLADELGRHPEASSDGRALERALLEVLPTLEGAFSFVLMDEGHVVGVRDPHGFRPLCLGKLDNGWVLASESPALDVVGAHFVRELEPGEMVIIDAVGLPLGAGLPRAGQVDPKLCLFEFVYFARPDSTLYGQSVHRARVRMGEQLAEQAPVEADLVMGVPESGMPGGRGLRPAQRHPLRPGPGQEPLHRAHLHRPQPGDAGARRAHEAQPAARQHRRPAPGRARRLDRAGHHQPGHRRACCARPARPRSTCASRRRPTGGPASTAWTPATGASSSPPT